MAVINEHKIRAGGHFVIAVLEDGVVRDQLACNLVMDSVLEQFAGAFRGEAVAGLEVTHIGVGTDGSPSSGGMTDLAAPVVRVPCSILEQTGKSTGWQCAFSEAEANGNTIREVGVFTAASGGTMIARAVVEPSIAKTSAVAIYIYYNLEVSA